MKIRFITVIFACAALFALSMDFASPTIKVIAHICGWISLLISALLAIKIATITWRTSELLKDKHGIRKK
jgi:hypothetical protein